MPSCHGIFEKIVIIFSYVDILETKTSYFGEPKLSCSKGITRKTWKLFFWASLSDWRQSRSPWFRIISWSRLQRLLPTFLRRLTPTLRMLRIPMSKTAWVFKCDHMMHMWVLSFFQQGGTASGGVCNDMCKPVPRLQGGSAAQLETQQGGDCGKNVTYHCHWISSWQVEGSQHVAHASWS